MNTRHQANRSRAMAVIAVALALGASAVRADTLASDHPLSLQLDLVTVLSSHRVADGFDRRFDLQPATVGFRLHF